MGVGSLLGTAGGFIAGGPTGAQVGGMIGSEADSLLGGGNGDAPSLVDPEQAAFLSEMEQKRKAVNTGSEFAQGERLAGQGLASTQENVVKAGGGDVGATMAGLNRAQRGYGQNINAILAEGEKNNKFFTSMGEDMLDRISERKYNLQLAEQAQNKVDKNQAEQDTQAGLNSLTARYPEAGGLLNVNQGQTTTAATGSGGSTTAPGIAGLTGSTGAAGEAGASGTPGAAGKTMFSPVNTSLPPLNLTPPPMGSVLNKFSKANQGSSVGGDLGAGTPVNDVSSLLNLVG